MNTPLEEIKRLRAELEQARQERDQAQADAAELRGLVSKYLEVTADQEPEDQHERDRRAYWRGWLDAEKAADEAHMAGTAHDRHGQVLPLAVPVDFEPEKDPDQVLREGDQWAQRQAGWWWKQYRREHPEPAREPVRELHPKARSRQPEREAG